MGRNILLEKLDYYGIRGVAKKLFESYLNNRKQFFTLNGSNQPQMVCLKGLSWGHYFSQSTLMIYTCVKYSKVYHFADDNNMLQSDNPLKNIYT